MKRVRWKPRYRTGAADVDARNRALVDLLEAFAAKLARKEHCQAMKEVYADLTTLAQVELDADPQALAREGGPRYAAVRELLATRFPLAARKGCILWRTWFEPKLADGLVSHVLD
jgi:hypothetical protein